MLAALSHDPFLGGQIEVIALNACLGLNNLILFATVERDLPTIFARSSWVRPNSFEGDDTQRLPLMDSGPLVANFQLAQR